LEHFVVVVRTNNLTT